jgi:hypothetical protein
MRKAAGSTQNRLALLRDEIKQKQTILGDLLIKTDEAKQVYVRQTKENKNFEDLTLRRETAARECKIFEDLRDRSESECKIVVAQLTPFKEELEGIRRAFARGQNALAAMQIELHRMQSRLTAIKAEFNGEMDIGRGELYRRYMELWSCPASASASSSPSATKVLKFQNCDHKMATTCLEACYKECQSDYAKTILAWVASKAAVCSLKYNEEVYEVHRDVEKNGTVTLWQQNTNTRRIRVLRTFETMSLTSPWSDMIRKLQNDGF